MSFKWSQTGLCCLALLIALSVAPASAVASDAPTGIWAEWDRATSLRCPSHHLDWLSDNYDELIDQFAHTIPSKINDEAVAIVTANYPRRCANDGAGFYCEMAVYLDAYKKLGMFDKFVAFTCQRYKCLDGAYCVNPKTNKL